RSLQHLVELLNELQALHCNLYLHQQAIDTTTPSGKAMFQMCGVFAEFERAMIVERVNSGLARAKAKGVKSRPCAVPLPPRRGRVGALFQVEGEMAAGAGKLFSQQAILFG